MSKAKGEGREILTIAVFHRRVLVASACLRDSRGIRVSWINNLDRFTKVVVAWPSPSAFPVAQTLLAYHWLTLNRRSVEFRAILDPGVYEIWQSSLYCNAVSQEDRCSIVFA